jgi:hypothetical protein
MRAAHKKFSNADKQYILTDEELHVLGGKHFPNLNVDGTYFMSKCLRNPTQQPERIRWPENTGTLDPANGSFARPGEVLFGEYRANPTGRLVRNK